MQFIVVLMTFISVFVLLLLVAGRLPWGTVQQTLLGEEGIAHIILYQEFVMFLGLKSLGPGRAWSSVAVHSQLDTLVSSIQPAEVVGRFPGDSFYCVFMPAIHKAYMEGG